MSRIAACRWSALALFLAVLGLTGLRAGGGEGETPAAGPIDDYDDFRQAPIRNADLLKMIEESDLIVVVGFDLKKVAAAAGGGEATWKANVAPYTEGTRPAKYKGTCGREITLKGDPKAFENPPGPYVSTKSFSPGNSFLVFLKALKEPEAEGVYRCVDLNPGGFRAYPACGPTDHRHLYVGKVNGRTVVEGIFASWGRASGPTLMTDVLRGLVQAGNLKLTVKAVEGAGSAVEVQLENATQWGSKVLDPLVLRAPFLWAEVEGPTEDTVLLSPEDYTPGWKDNPWSKRKEIKKGVPPVTARLELPTGPVPKGGDIFWMHSSHAKSLAGSLGPGEHTVRLLYRADLEAVIISGPVKVQGKAGAAGPAELAKLERPSPFAPIPDAPPEKGLPPLKETVRGEIWFDTNRDGNWEIYRMDANGSNLVNLTKTPDKDEFGAVVSPDGTLVAFHGGARGIGEGGMWGRWNIEGKQIWVMDRDGSNLRKLADNAITPAWWPDSKSVLYNSKKDGACLHNLETGSVTSPTKATSSPVGVGVSFAPGARKFLGSAPWNALSPANTVVTLDEQGQYKECVSLLATYHGCTHRWASPEGKRIIYAHHDPRHRGEIILWSMRPDGTEARRFWRTGDGWPGYGMYCESPDERMFVAATWNEMQVVRYADGASLPLTQKQGSNLAPHWHRGPKAIQEERLQGRLKDAGEKGDERVRLCRLFMKENEDNAYAQLAGLELLVKALGEGAFGDLLQALGRPLRARGALSGFAAGMQGQGLTEKFIAALKDAPPPARAGLLEVLALRTDQAALPVAKQYLGDENEVVRIAARSCLARLGGKAELGELFKALEGGTPAERAAVESELLRMADPEVGPALAGALAGAGTAAKLSLLLLLTQRAESAQVEAVLGVAADKEESVRLAALKALGALATDKSLPALAGLLGKAQADGERQAAEAALRGAFARIKDPEKCAGAVKAALEGALPAGSCALLRMLGLLGGPQALPLVQGQLANPDAQVQEAAVRTLAGWKSPDACEALLGQVRGNPNKAMQLLAHQAYTRLVGLPGKVAPEAVAAHQAGLETALRNEEKVLLLGSLGRIKGLEALKLAEQYFAEEPLQTPAGNALVALAGGLGPPNQEEAKAVLRKVLGAAKENNLKTAAQNALAQIELYEDHLAGWQVSGPYHQAGKDGAALLEAAFPPEDPEAKEVGWKEVPAGAAGVVVWQVDLAKVVGGENRVAYLRTAVDSPQDQEVVLELGSDEGLKVWLNGQLIHTNNAKRALRPGDDKVKTVLKAGANTLLLKVGNSNGPWGACARFRKADGSRLGGLKGKAS